MHAVLLGKINPVLQGFNDPGVVKLCLRPGIVRQNHVVLSGEALKKPVRKAARRNLHAVLRDFTARIFLGKFL